MEFIVLPGVLNFRTWLNGVASIRVIKKVSDMCEVGH